MLVSTPWWPLLLLLAACMTLSLSSLDSGAATLGGHGVVHNPPFIVPGLGITPFSIVGGASRLHPQANDTQAGTLEALHTKYKSRFVCCHMPMYPEIDVYLCGTLHVAKTSAEMVQEVIRTIKPSYVVLELCEARADSLHEVDLNHLANVTLSSVVRLSFEERSLKTFGMGMLSWMQLKSAKVMGNRLGGELAMAAREGASLQSVVVLGDRLYGVTIQRIFDKLHLVEKVKMVVLLFWEVLTMSIFRLKEYVHKSETDDSFITDEIRKFRKHLPTFATVIVTERDEYLAQTLLEIARVGFRQHQPMHPSQAAPRGRIVAVIGAAHLAGVQRCLSSGGCSDEHIAEISSSSKHNSTWAGRGMLQIVNTQSLFGS